MSNIINFILLGNSLSIQALTSFHSSLQPPALQNTALEKVMCAFLKSHKRGFRPCFELSIILVHLSQLFGYCFPDPSQPLWLPLWILSDRSCFFTDHLTLVLLRASCSPWLSFHLSNSPWVISSAPLVGELPHVTHSSEIFFSCPIVSSDSQIHIIIICQLGISTWMTHSHFNSVHPKWNELFYYLLTPSPLLEPPQLRLILGKEYHEVNHC